MAEEGEDLFGSIIKFCQPTSSQELKLQSCLFVRESETFPNYFDSLATSSPEQPPPLEPVGIVIASPPESQSENNSSSIGKSNNTQENENEDFLTPPEHHNPSSSSSQEDPVRVKPGCDSKVSVSAVAETRAGGDEYVESEANVGLRKGGEILGFEETEKFDSCDDVLEGKCGDIEGFERELKRFRVFDHELNRTMAKKIRVSEENWDSDKVNNDTEIIDLETEENDDEAWENVEKASDGMTEGADEAGMTEKCGSDDDDDVDHSEKEKGVDLDGGDNCLKVNGNLEPEESGDGDRYNGNNEAVQRDGKAVLGSSIVETCKKFWRGSPGNGAASIVKEKDLRGRHVLPSPIKEKDMGGDESIINSEEVEKTKNSGTRNDMNQRAKEHDVACNGGDEHFKVNGTPPLAVYEKRIRHNSNDKVKRNNGKAVLSSSIIEKIDKFRYEGPANGVDHSPKERVARERRELPSSITGKEKDMGGQENGGYVKVKSNGSWKDLVDALEAVFGRTNDGCEVPDFLETAKKRGLTFPVPRWWIDD